MTNQNGLDDFAIKDQRNINWATIKINVQQKDGAEYGRGKAKIFSLQIGKIAKAD